MIITVCKEEKKADVEKYIAETKRKSDLERVTGEKERVVYLLDLLS